MVFNLEGKKGEVIVVSQCRPQTALLPPAPLRNFPSCRACQGGGVASLGVKLVLAQAGHNRLITPSTIASACVVCLII